MVTQEDHAALEQQEPLPGVKLPLELDDILANCPGFTVAGTAEQLQKFAIRDVQDGVHKVRYEVPGRGLVTEAVVFRVRNGLAANYPEPYMRRRDPDCMFIGDNLPTGKPTFKGHFGRDFETVRQETFTWLKQQELALFAFAAGSRGKGVDALAVVPARVSCARFSTNSCERFWFRILRLRGAGSSIAA